ncbi:MAG: aminotransferase class I/II-fold pyridoxal phosphate-dependent enzyme, partial [Eggerthellaceae bacterium]|nr:aminotransferase class I/II-fold pyridoxal phosphate-dependent enzyme [Eggerthellaceae bacterium]
MDIREFGIEVWMNDHEEGIEINLSETCVKPFTIAELLALTADPEATWHQLREIQLTYGDIIGSPALRLEISRLYTSMQPENILVTHGGIGANDLVITTIVNPGDRVISILPTYQQLYSIPESLGAEMKICHLRP